MVSICDGVVLSLYLAPVTISSELRADVPGDFAVSMDMGSMSKGGYHFAREPVVTIANVLKLRCVVGAALARVRCCVRLAAFLFAGRSGMWRDAGGGGAPERAWARREERWGDEGGLLTREKKCIKKALHKHVSYACACFVCIASSLPFSAPALCTSFSFSLSLCVSFSVLPSPALPQPVPPSL